jgi:hypothetical protein
VTFIHHKEFFQWQSNGARKELNDGVKDQEMEEVQDENIAIFLKKLLES